MKNLRLSALLTVGLFLLSGASAFAQTSTPTLTPTPTSSPTLTSSPTPSNTPTPTATPNYAYFHIHIANIPRPQAIGPAVCAFIFQPATNYWSCLQFSGGAPTFTALANIRNCSTGATPTPGTIVYGPTVASENPGPGNYVYDAQVDIPSALIGTTIYPAFEVYQGDTNFPLALYRNMSGGNVVSIVPAANTHYESNWNNVIYNNGPTPTPTPH